MDAKAKCEIAAQILGFCRFSVDSAKQVCGREDLNLHGCYPRDLSLERLPLPPQGSSPFRPTAVPAARRPTEISRKQDASKMEAEDHMNRPDFPTMEQVEKATHEQLARWYRFLPSGDTKEQQKIQDRIAERFKELGGMNPALSKKIGF